MSPIKPVSYCRYMPKENSLDELQDTEFKRNTKLYQRIQGIKKKNRNEHFIELQEDNKHVTDIQEN